MRSICLSLSIIVATPILAAAQGAAAEGGANPVSGSVRSSWETAKGYIRQSAELMPEANYSFRPVDSVRTFGQILAHLAGANYVICAAAKGEKSPHSEDAFEKTAKTRADILKALTDSLTYCDGAYNALNDRTAGETVDLPFGMGKGARLAPLLLNTGHLLEHYGNLVTYFRMNNIVPPSSRGQ